MNFAGAIHFNKIGICVIGVCFLILILYITRSINVANIINEELDELNIKKLLLTSIELAEKGGQEVIKVKEEHDYKIKSKGLTNEGAQDPVTEADYNSHCVMYYGFKKIFPQLQIVSEEERSEEDCKEKVTDLASNFIQTENIDISVQAAEETLPAQDITVWIDPLDATQEFTENLLEYVTTLVCVAYKGQPIIGVIHTPFTKPPKTSWAWVNKAVSTDLELQKKINPDIIVSRSHTGPVEKLIHDALGNDVKIIKAGGAGYKVMQLISGNATAYIHSKYIKKWDVCAGNAILKAVNGQMTTLKNEDLDYSFNADHVNSHGIIATVNNHDYYAKKLENFIIDHIV